MRTRILLLLVALFPLHAIGHGQEPGPESRPQTAPQAQREFAPPENIQWRARRDGGRVARNIEYARPGGRSQLLDIYLPAGTGPFPVILWVHGGGWRGGNKNSTPAEDMLAAGFAAVSINYRLVSAGPMPAQIQDVTAAVRWIRAWCDRLPFNPNAIGAWGASAGGHLVALLGTAGDHELFCKGPNTGYSSRVQAVCDWFGPAEMESISSAPMVAALLGNAEGDELAYRARVASPVTFVDHNDPPFLIQHGDRDRIVALDQSKKLHAALLGVGVHSTLRVVRGAGHGRFRAREVVAQIRRFFVRHLRPSVPEDVAARRREVANKKLTDLDRDGDQRISRAEYPGDMPAFDLMDTNRDGYVSLDELTADLDAMER